jgi:hypothetical protein
VKGAKVDIPTLLTLLLCYFLPSYRFSWSADGGMVDMEQGSACALRGYGVMK